MNGLEFYRGPRSDRSVSRSHSERYDKIGETRSSKEYSNERNAYSFYTGPDISNADVMNDDTGKGTTYKTINSTSRETENSPGSGKTFDSTGKQKSFRRLLIRFAEKTSMQGVTYINSAKFWWARFIWCFMLLVAIAAMSAHLWYLIDQYSDYPVQTRISLGFETLKFPQITICNTNVMHKGRFEKYDNAEILKELLENLHPENLVPDQFDPNYDPFAKKPATSGDQLGNDNQGKNEPPQGESGSSGGEHGDSNKGQSGSGLSGSNSSNGQQDGGNKGQSGSGLSGSGSSSGQQDGDNKGQSGSGLSGSGSSSGQQDGGNKGQSGSGLSGSGSSNGQQDDGKSDSRIPRTRNKRFLDKYKALNKTKFGGKDRPNFREILPRDKNDYDGEVDSRTELEDLFYWLFMEIPKHDRAELGHNITDMLIRCTFNGRMCRPEMFSLHQTSEYGNCWSINSKKFKVKHSGPSGGLSMVFYLESTEYLKGLTTGYGIRIQIHGPRTYPFPAEEGLFIPASMETDIGLRMVSITRESGLYGECNDGQDLEKTTKYKYTRSVCQMLCLTNQIVETCQCYDDRLEELAMSKNNGLKQCRNESEIMCMMKIKKKFLEKEVPCSCSNSCNEVLYVKSVSQRQWPDDHYAMVLLQNLCNKDPDVCSSLRKFLPNPKKIKNNFLKLNIYYEDLNYENLTEVPEIELQQFLSDVGGAIGLWIGLSILSLCELIQLFVELCDYGIHKVTKETEKGRRQRRKVRTNLAIAADNRIASNDKGNWPRKHFTNDSDNSRSDYDFTKNQQSDRFKDYSCTGNDVIYHDRWMNR